MSWLAEISTNLREVVVAHWRHVCDDALYKRPHLLNFTHSLGVTVTVTKAGVMMMMMMMIAGR